MSLRELFYFVCKHSMFVGLFSIFPFHTFDQQSGKSNFLFDSKIIIIDIHPWRPYKNQHGWTLVACSGPKSWIFYLSRTHQLFLLFCPPKLILPAAIVPVVTLHFIVMFKHHALLPDSQSEEIHFFSIEWFPFSISMFCLIWYHSISDHDEVALVLFEIMSTYKANSMLWLYGAYSGHTPIYLKGGVM